MSGILLRGWRRRVVGVTGGGWLLTVPGLIFRLVLIQLLHFHPSVLEPYFNLSLSQVQLARYFVPPVPREVHVEQELFLQFQGLVFRVRTPLLPGRPGVEPVCRWVICK